MFHSIKILITCLASLILIGCGFHLREVTSLPAFAQKIYLNTPFPYSTFTRQLKAGLRQAHAEVVSNPQQSSMTLNILSENFVVQPNSLASSQQTRSYQLIYTIDYSAQDKKGNVLAHQRSLVTQSSLTLFPNEQVVGNSKIDQAKEWMEQDLVTQLTAQLNVLQAAPSSKKNQGPTP